ncbi:uncharacterized protein LOC102680664, partial [Apis dorsata]|uniref:uncharacterized protein LOC102680664 n=1 Tax=Apis dorsata TaxID=7462 RepID=UPI0003DF6E5A
KLSKRFNRVSVAVVVAFFICWAPFHAQRLLAVYAQNSKDKPEDALVIIYTILTYMSGVFYYLSTTVNPLLYNIMSNKFREAFKSMLPNCCVKWSSQKSEPRRPIYSSLSRYPRYTFRQTNDRQNSPSISVSDDNQKLTSIVRISNMTEYNRLTELNNEQKLPNSTMNKINNREYKRSVSRGSNSNQFILMTTVNEGNNNMAPTYTNECLLNIQKPSRTLTLGILAEKLRLETKELFSPQQKTKSNLMKLETTPAISPSRFQSHPSIDSANTISNSSLQDYDETEFSGMELARYMGELNCDLIA